MQLEGESEDLLVTLLLLRLSEAALSQAEYSIAGGSSGGQSSEGGWGEHCTGLCKMVVDTAEKGMR